MSKLTRREWGQLALGGLAAASLPAAALTAAAQRRVKRTINSRFNGVLLGAQSYSFRDMSLDDMLKAMAEIGIGSCELWAGHLEPKEVIYKSWGAKDAKVRADARAELRRWRLETPLSLFREARAKFERAGVDLYAFNYSMSDDFTDAEMEQGFRMARALGAKVMTASSNVSTARRIDAFARKYRMRVGLHNHSNNDDPNALSTPESFARALEGRSSYTNINLDIGHFTAANWDAPDFLRRHHHHIVTLHVKDRKRNQGENVPFGQGDTPIKETLALLRANRWPIPANIEYEYEGADTVTEVRRCFDYCKEALGV
jgi:sugar phosphate isomerase/epimerase